MVQPTTNSALSVYNSRPHSLDTCGKLPGTLGLLAVLNPSVPTLCHYSTLDVMHVGKDTRLYSQFEG